MASGKATARTATPVCMASGKATARPEIKPDPESKLEPEIKQEPFTIRGYFGLDA